MFSVLLAVYSRERPAFLDKALRSIWDDQPLKPGQIVLVEDGPLPHDIEEIIHKWHAKIPNILTLVKFEKNVGLAEALNEGLKYCNFDLVARMDTDDVSLPSRFIKQIRYMNEFPHIAASSAQVEEWDEFISHRIGIRKVPEDSEEIKRFAKGRSPLNHPAVIFRKSIVQSVGGYPSFRKAQDYALWSLLLTKGFKLGNLPDSLLIMRTGNQMLSQRRGRAYLKYEHQLLKFQRDIGFLTWREYLRNLLLKEGLRCSPNFMKSLAYRFLR